MLTWAGSWAVGGIITYITAHPGDIVALAAGVFGVTTGNATMIAVATLVFAYSHAQQLEYFMKGLFHLTVLFSGFVVLLLGSYDLFNLFNLIGFQPWLFGLDVRDVGMFASCLYLLTMWRAS